MVCALFSNRGHSLIARTKSLTPQQLRELATLVSTGVPIASAWEKSSAFNHPSGTSVHRLLNQGSSLSQSLSRTKLLTSTQRIVLAAADDSGKQPEALLRLAADAERRAERHNRLRSKWGVIYMLLLVGWSVGMIVSLTSGTDNPVASFFSHTIKSLFACLVIRFAGSLVTRDSWWWLALAWKLHAQSLKPFRLSIIVNWFDLLGWQLSAGLDAESALRNMANLIPAKPYRNSVNSAASAVRNGQSLANALNKNDLIPNNEMLGVLTVGEASGKLGESLALQTTLSEQFLQLYLDVVETWLPRVLYAFVAGLALSMVY